MQPLAELRILIGRVARWAPAPSSGRSLAMLAGGTVIGLLVAGAGLFSAHGATFGVVPPEDVALVNQRPILFSDFIAQLESEFGSYKTSTAAQRQKVLDDMIAEELAVQRGLELDLPGTNGDVRAALVSGVELQVVANVLAARPTEAQMRAYYQDHRERYRTNGTLSIDELWAPASGAPTSDEIHRVSEAAKALLQGAPAASVARRYSMRETGRVRNDTFDLTAKLRLGSELYRAVETLGTGDVSTPVTLSDGIHLIRIKTRVAPVLPPFEQSVGTVYSDYLRDARTPVEAANRRYLRKKAHILLARGLPRMKARAVTGLVLALLVFCLAGPVKAHTRSESHSSWALDGTTVRLVYAVPLVELKRLTGDGSPPSQALQNAYIESHLWVTAQGGPCRRMGATAALASDQVFRRTQMTFLCGSPIGLRLHATAFFDIVPSHMHFAQIQTASGDFVEQLFTKNQQSLDLSRPVNKLSNANFADFVAMGATHIFTGVDHISFLIGLVLISKRLRDLLFVVTGFTIGHSLTLALAVLGVIRPHAEYIDALVALTILLIGAENIAVASQRPGLVAAGVGGLLLLMSVGKLAGFGGLPLLLTLGAALFSACYLMLSVGLGNAGLGNAGLGNAGLGNAGLGNAGRGNARRGNAGRVRLLVTVVFGLIHGFGFAAGLLDMDIPKVRLAELLVGFNLGVEIGQVCIVVSIVGAVLMLRRLRLAPPRAIVVDTTSGVLAGIGAYWFLGRSFGL